jgi:hypothetical protein
VFLIPDFKKILRNLCTDVVDFTTYTIEEAIALQSLGLESIDFF